MVNDRTTISREVMWQMGQQYEDVLFHTVIHNSVEAAKAAAAGNMIAVRTKLGAEYAALAEEIIQYDDLQGIRGQMMKQIRIKTYDEKKNGEKWYLKDSNNDLAFGFLRTSAFSETDEDCFQRCFCEIAMKMRYRFLSSSL